MSLLDVTCAELDLSGLALKKRTLENAGLFVGAPVNHRWACVVSIGTSGIVRGTGETPTKAMLETVSRLRKAA